MGSALHQPWGFTERKQLPRTCPQLLRTANVAGETDTEGILSRWRERWMDGGLDGYNMAGVATKLCRGRNRIP